MVRLTKKHALNALIENDPLKMEAKDHMPNTIQIMLGEHHAAITAKIPGYTVWMSYSEISELWEFAKSQKKLVKRRLKETRRKQNKRARTNGVTILSNEEGE